MPNPVRSLANQFELVFSPTTETDTDEEDSFGGSTQDEQSADSSNSHQYMVLPLSSVTRSEIGRLINNRRPIVAANRDTGLYLNENQLRNLLAVSRYRS